jgi:CheY-like chemotaxis protein
MTQSQVHFLVVDDERNIRRNLTMVLESAGYKVDATGDGEEALAKSKERHYDIALVDIQMPKMGGLELLRYLRTLRPNLAVVILTAYGTVGSAVEAMKLGAVEFSSCFVKKSSNDKRRLRGVRWTTYSISPSWLESGKLMWRRASISRLRCCAKSPGPNLITGSAIFLKSKETNGGRCNTTLWHSMPAKLSSRRGKLSRSWDISTPGLPYKG